MTSLPTSIAPEDIGLSTAGLNRLSAVLRGEVERKRVPGAVALIARRGRIGSQQPQRVSGCVREGDVLQLLDVAARVPLPKGRRDGVAACRRRQKLARCRGSSMRR